MRLNPIESPSLSKKFTSFGSTKKPGAGFSQLGTRSGRPSEDSGILVWFDPQEGIDSIVEESQIKNALHQSYLALDNKFKGAKIGSTAVTVVFNGKSIITATAGDSVAFIVGYNDDGISILTKRLNSMTHKPYWEEEKNRIERLGGSVENNRTCGILAISRAIGDNHKIFKNTVTAEPLIDEISLDSLKEAHPDVKKWQIIACSDGLTDRFGLSLILDPIKEVEMHEKGLARLLEPVQVSSDMALIRHILKDGLTQRSASAFSPLTDDLTIVACTIENEPCLVGVYDGHGGSEVSKTISNEIAQEFLKHLTMSPYQKLEESSIGTSDITATQNLPEILEIEYTTLEEQPPLPKNERQTFSAHYSIFSKACSTDLPSPEREEKQPNMK